MGPKAVLADITASASDVVGGAVSAGITLTKKKRGIQAMENGYASPRMRPSSSMSQDSNVPVAQICRQLTSTQPEFESAQSLGSSADKLGTSYWMTHTMDR